MGASSLSQYPKLYNSKRWKQIRLDTLARDPLCVMCIKIGDHAPSTIADHVEPHRGNEHRFFNGRTQGVCKPCHDRHKQRQEKSGILLGGDNEGVPVDPLHHWNN